MQNIVIYTKENCPTCIRAKSLLENHHYSFQEIKIGIDISREEILMKFPDAKTAPIIIINENRIGGSTELQILLETERIKLL